MQPLSRVLFNTPIAESADAPAENHFLAGESTAGHPLPISAIARETCRTALANLSNTQHTEAARCQPSVRPHSIIQSGESAKEQARINRPVVVERAFKLRPVDEDGRSAISISTKEPTIVGRETASQPNGSGVTDKRVSRKHVQLGISQGSEEVALLVTALGTNPIGVRHACDASSAAEEATTMTLVWRGQQVRLEIGDQISLVVEPQDGTLEQEQQSCEVCGSRCSLVYTLVEEAVESAVEGVEAASLSASVEAASLGARMCSEVTVMEPPALPSPRLLSVPRGTTEGTKAAMEREAAKAPPEEVSQVAASDLIDLSASPPPPPCSPAVQMVDSNTSPLPPPRTPEGEWLLRLLNDLQFFAAGSRGPRRVRDYSKEDYFDASRGPYSDWDTPGLRSDLRVAVESLLGMAKQQGEAAKARNLQEAARAKAEAAQAMEEAERAKAEARRAAEEMRREAIVQLEQEVAKRLPDRVRERLTGDCDQLHSLEDVYRFFERRQQARVSSQPRLRIETAVRVHHDAAAASYVASPKGFDINPISAFALGGDTVLFHGTNEASVANIQATGRPSMEFSAKGMLGKGIYGAPDPRKSVNYCKTNRNGRFMFICRFNLSQAQHAGPHTQHRNTLFDEFCVYDDNHVVVLWVLKLIPDPPP